MTDSTNKEKMLSLISEVSKAAERCGYGDDFFIIKQGKAIFASDVDISINHIEVGDELPLGFRFDGISNWAWARKTRNFTVKFGKKVERDD